MGILRYNNVKSENVLSACDVLICIKIINIEL